VIDVPGETPRLPSSTLGPVLVTAEPPSTAYSAVVARGTVATMAALADPEKASGAVATAAAVIRSAARMRPVVVGELSMRALSSCVVWASPRAAPPPQEGSAP
jgi:hypothetical protein